MKLIKQVWNGDRPLWEMFWVWSVVGLFVFGRLVWWAIEFEYPPWWVLTTVSYTYYVFVMVGMWRSSSKHEGFVLFRLGARVLVLFWLIRMLQGLAVLLNLSLFG